MYMGVQKHTEPAENNTGQKRGNMKKLYATKNQANKIKRGDLVKLPFYCSQKQGRVITKTENKITVLVDSGCYDFLIR